MLGGLEQGRDVALDELVLQGEGGGGDDDATVVQQGRDEVAQGLAGARAGLDEQVLGGPHGPGDRLGHLDLAGALLAPQRLDGAGQHLADPGGGAGVGRGHRSTLPSGGDASGHLSTGGVR